MKQHETGRFRSGQLAILILLIVGLAGMFPVFAKECIDDWQCDDDVWCNGAEFCGEGGTYLEGKCYDSVEGSPCSFDEICIESLDQCVDSCTDASDCDPEGLFCNGQEQCIDGACWPGSDPCPDMYCDEPADMCRPDACTIPDGEEHISHFTGLNCSGIESYYTTYFSGYPYFEDYNCRPYDTIDALCGVELRTETNKSYYDADTGDCTNAWTNPPNTLDNFARVYRPGIHADGNGTSYFTGPGCTGTEFYRPDSDMTYLCRPDGSDYADCGKEMYKETVTSTSVDGVCQDSYPGGSELNGLLKVYRGCGVYETSECGDGVCKGNETCLSCPEDCSDCCVEPDGEQISYFTDFSCEGAEYYQVPADDFEYECAPANPDGAVCGTVLHTERVLSYGTPDWCVHSFPQPLVFTTQKKGLVRVYRDGCVAEEAPECGDGICNGIENCAWCPGDCGGPCSGNGFCDIGECSAYPDDCSIDECCGNGVCDDMGDNPPENCLNCEEDCGECPDPDPYCGDGVCNGKENWRTCPEDCAKTNPGNKPAT